MGAIRNTFLQVAGFPIPVALNGVTESRDPALTLERAWRLPDGTYTTKAPAEVPEVKAATLEQGSVQDEVLAGLAAALRGDEGESEAAPAALVTGAVGPVLVQGKWLDGEFVEISGDRLDEIAKATRLEHLEVDRFVPLRDVPFDRVTGSYYLSPVRGGLMAGRLAEFRNALKNRKRAAVLKMMLKPGQPRERVAVVYERAGALRLATLAFYAEVARGDVAAAAALDGATVNRHYVGLFGKIIDTLAADATVLDGYRNTLVERRDQLVEQAVQGHSLDVPAAVASVADDASLEDLLERSVTLAQQRRASS